MTKPVAFKRRCAIYTRKSSEEGLDMEFNSLDAQREACEAFIVSQKAEGWLRVGDRFDDGGFSGGTLDRPALKRLLADIEEGLIDVVVVYKIDRLSRSLMTSPGWSKCLTARVSPSSASPSPSTRQPPWDA
jgi:DNA invertase Pin-like site-specific DNA recombinase